MIDDDIENKEGEILDLIDDNETIDLHYLRVVMAMDNEDYTMAMTRLNNIPTQFDLTERQAAEWSDYLLVCQTIIDHINSGTQQLTTAQISVLEDIGDKQSNSAAGMANQVLVQLGSIHIPFLLVHIGAYLPLPIITYFSTLSNIYNNL